MRTIITTAAALLLSAAHASADDQPDPRAGFSITWSTISAGGPAQGGGFSILAAIGQPATATMSVTSGPGTYTLSGGFLGSTTGGDPPCPADINGDGELNFFDVAAFVALFQAQDPIADFNNDGLFNFFDFSAFIAAFNAGCP
ncbi:MAG: hypothetical protein LAT64_06445 [Phycisphaerales bacterium]|nr:hypothetical protein [Planctomycetota bacterium]MCH8508395.1 hypothetical protein [Phycisphaerales bacterium]